MDDDLSALHAAFMDLIGVFNRPAPDRTMLAEAGVDLDRALFPLLVRIGRRGPIGVVDLAEVSGRDHSTVSRQVAKLESLGLVARRPGAKDRRVHEAALTDKGRAMTDQLDAARNRLMNAALADWSAADRRDLVRLVCKLADQAVAWTADGSNSKA